ncbi:MAG: BrnA antitoxin family protein [Rhodobacteraceae bacterium]|nr:BrnA antitoxin family protein [Paracoccaceae bacterium]
MPTRPSPRTTPKATPRPAAEHKRRASYTHLAQTLRGLEDDLRWGMRGSARIPPEWHAIAQADPVPGKRHISIRVDEDVLQFFRSMGAGHLPRMNAVLRAFMLARLAGVVQGPEDVDHGQDALHDLDREAAGLKRDLPGLVQEMLRGAKPDTAATQLLARLEHWAETVKGLE